MGKFPLAYSTFAWRNLLFFVSKNITPPRRLEMTLSCIDIRTNQAVYSAVHMRDRDIGEDMCSMVMVDESRYKEPLLILQASDGIRSVRARDGQILSFAPAPLMTHCILIGSTIVSAGPVAFLEADDPRPSASRIYEFVVSEDGSITVVNAADPILLEEVCVMPWISIAIDPQTVVMAAWTSEAVFLFLVVNLSQRSVRRIPVALPPLREGPPFWDMMKGFAVYDKVLLFVYPKTLSDHIWQVLRAVDLEAEVVLWSADINTVRSWAFPISSVTIHARSATVILCLNFVKGYRPPMFTAAGIQGRDIFTGELKWALDDPNAPEELCLCHPPDYEPLDDLSSPDNSHEDFIFGVISCTDDTAYAVGTRLGLRLLGMSARCCGIRQSVVDKYCSIRSVNRQDQIRARDGGILQEQLRLAQSP